MTYFIQRQIKPCKESFFLFGPRGTGKSTWLKHTYPNALRIDLLNPEQERAFLAKPERLIELCQALPQGHQICIIDEIQRVPSLLPVIHLLIEEKRDIQFILTGSSARKLRKMVGNLLGGRLLIRHMPPFLAAELGDQFNLPQALQLGLIPLIQTSRSPNEQLKGYINAYLKEEVQAEGLVRQIGDFARFMEVASFSHGSLWSSSEIARESQVKRQTVDNYLEILHDLFLAFSLPVFTRRAQRALTSHQKFYYFDAGVFRALRPTGPLDKETEIEGPALEGLVAQHLKAWVNSQTDNHQLAFWRTQTQVEIDFVIYGPKGFWGIEVKRSPHVHPNDVKSLKIFKDEYPEATCFLLYTGKHPLIVREILCLPVEDFLRNLHPDKNLLT